MAPQTSLVCMIWTSTSKLNFYCRQFNSQHAFSSREVHLSPRSSADETLIFCLLSYGRYSTGLSVRNHEPREVRHLKLSWYAGSIILQRVWTRRSKIRFLRSSRKRDITRNDGLRRLWRAEICLRLTVMLRIRIL